MTPAANCAVIRAASSCVRAARQSSSYPQPPVTLPSAFPWLGRFEGLAVTPRRILAALQPEDVVNATLRPSLVSPERLEAV
jgi:hypothetical protein